MYTNTDCINNDRQNPYYYDNHGCMQGAISATETGCPAGNYCPAGSLFATPCPIGTYSSSTLLTAASECTDCDAGMYCFTRGNTGDALEISPCAAGYYCPVGSDESSAEECPSGAMCPGVSSYGPGASEPTYCTPGFY